MKILITISIILAAIIVTYIFYKVAVGIQRKVLARLCEDTEDYITYNLGYVVFVDGNIGAGKTTLSAGITNMRSYQYQLDALDKINEIVNILYYIDFIWSKCHKGIEHDGYSDECNHCNDYGCSSKKEYYIDTINLISHLDYISKKDIGKKYF